MYILAGAQRYANCFMCACDCVFHFTGTRYRRRGVDDNGDVANYVETEQVHAAYQNNTALVVKGLKHVFSFLHILSSFCPAFFSAVRFGPCGE